MLWEGRWEGGSCLGTHVRIKDFKIKKNKKVNAKKNKMKKKKKRKKTIPMEKKCEKAKWLSGEALQIAMKRREAKSQGEK